MAKATLDVTLHRVKGALRRYRVKLGGLRIGEVTVEPNDGGVLVLWEERVRLDAMTDEGIDTLVTAVDDAAGEL